MKITASLKSTTVLEEGAEGWTIYIYWGEVIDKAKRTKKGVYIAFLDIEKAYDRVDRKIMCKVLRRVDFEENLVKVIESMYVNMRAKISLGDLYSEWVYSKRGVRQECTLSPLLFSLYTEELPMRIRDMGLGFKVGEGEGNTLGCLLYLDDIVFLAEDNETIRSSRNMGESLGLSLGL